MTAWRITICDNPIKLIIQRYEVYAQRKFTASQKSGLLWILKKICKKKTRDVMSVAIPKARRQTLSYLDSVSFRNNHCNPGAQPLCPRQGSFLFLTEKLCIKSGPLRARPLSQALLRLQFVAKLTTVPVPEPWNSCIMTRHIFWWKISRETHSSPYGIHSQPTRKRKFSPNWIKWWTKSGSSPRPAPALPTSTAVLYATVDFPARRLLLRL